MVSFILLPYCSNEWEARPPQWQPRGLDAFGVYVTTDRDVDVRIEEGGKPRLR
jgi:hypothetical protein